GKENWYRFHNVFIFEMTDTRWYLVQSEYIPSESGVVIEMGWGNPESENVPEELKPFIKQYSQPTLSGVLSWPLFIGDNFTSKTELHPIEGKMMNGSKWTVKSAASQKKPTVLYFFSVHALSVTEPEDFDTQMNFLSGLYDKFGHKDLYIFGVTDDLKDEVDWLGESGYTNFSPLLDEGSKMHAALNIDMHPYLVVFDSAGTVVAISKTFHPSSNPLIENRIREVIAKAKAIK
ncbi:MAG: hypothetical protein ABIC40_06795, partial [bacterium]